MFPRILISAAAIGSMALPSLQAQQPCQFTLVNEAGFNASSIRLTVPLVGNDTETSNLTGTLDCTVNIDPNTDQSDELTINSADITPSNVTFNISNWLTGSVNLTSSNLKATAFTTTPPGVVTPATGAFDSTQHEFSVNQGTLDGTALGGPLTVNLANTPLNGGGINTGALTIALTGETVTHKTYDLTAVFEIFVSTDVPTGFILLGSEVIANVQITGLNKAAGTCKVYFSPYLQWTDENNIPGHAFDANSLGKTPNGVLWALGYDNSNIPEQLLIPVGGNITIPLPASGTAHNAIIESSTTLSGWAPIDITKVSTGSSTILAGSTGTITITPDGPSTFYRIRVVE